jgi:putative ABC transport system ATP-binding protein
MIQVEDIKKTYAKGNVVTEVLKGISFRIEEKEFVSIMGPSGTGKSTLMNILGAMDKPSSGCYSLGGVDIATLNDDDLSLLRNRSIGFVFQQFHLLERATVLRNVMLPLVYEDGAGGNSRQRGEDVVRAVGLEERMNYRPTELSGGQQQRVAIARALVTDPVILLADEPTGNLDYRNGLEILSLFQQLNREGRTIVMITHDREVAEYAQRVLVLQDGRIAEDRKVETPRDAEKELQALGDEEKSTKSA